MTTTLLLVIVIIGISLYAWSKPQLLQNMLMNPYRIYHDKQYYRFITSGFIHNGYLHLFFNTFTLFFFGTNIERVIELQFGDAAVIALPGLRFNYVFVLFFLAAVVVSDIPTFLKHRDKIYYNSLGASGGVSAIIFASILFFPLSALSFILIPVRIPAFLLGTLFLIYSYYQSKNAMDNVNHDAHLYGAVFGLVSCAVAQPQVLLSFVQQLSQFNLTEWQWF